MYSVKPWGRAAVVGNTVAGLVLGIGMRWRETVTELVDAHDGPDYENTVLRRCVLSQNSLQILQDVGMSAGALDRDGHLRPAGVWRFVTDDGLDVIREGASYPGCAPVEATFQIAEGALIRALRREFVRFGGVVHWGCRAGAPFVMSDGSGFWALQKEYGAINEVECVIGTSRTHTDCATLLFGEKPWAARPMVRFPVTTGWCPLAEFPDPGRSRCFPPAPSNTISATLGGDSRNDVDFVVVLGKGCALHMWKTHALATSREQRSPDKAIVSWRLTSRPIDAAEHDEADARRRAGSNASLMGTLHPDLRLMFAKSRNVVHDMVSVPTASCALIADAATARATVAGDCMLPVDPFEFRGDGALVAIEESAALVRRLFKEKYYRGFVPVDFREHEMDLIARRTKLVQRDLSDAEVFLNAADQIAENKRATAALGASAAAGPSSATAAPTTESA